jgi:hypothetical protein
MKEGGLSIWFLIGLILAVYGVLVAAAGIWQAVFPPPDPVVLADLHAGIYWGALMLAVGIFYIVRFRPR